MKWLLGFLDIALRAVIPIQEMSNFLSNTVCQLKSK
jgi:hypothetical protein